MRTTLGALSLSAGAAAAANAFAISIAARSEWHAREQRVGFRRGDVQHELLRGSHAEPVANGLLVNVRASEPRRALRSCAQPLMMQNKLTR